MLLAQNEIAGGWKSIDDYLPSIRSVSAADIQRVANRYFTPDNRTTGILVPLPPRENRPQTPGTAIKKQIVR